MIWSICWLWHIMTNIPISCVQSPKKSSLFTPGAWPNIATTLQRSWNAWESSTYSSKQRSAPSINLQCSSLVTTSVTRVSRRWRPSRTDPHQLPSRNSNGSSASTTSTDVVIAPSLALSPVCWKTSLCPGHHLPPKPSTYSKRHSPTHRSSSTQTQRNHSSCRWMHPLPG